MTTGVHIAPGEDAAETVVARWDDIMDATTAFTPADALQQSRLELAKAGYQGEGQ